MKQSPSTRNTGISNRETASDERRERGRHPPLDAGSPEPDAGPVDESALGDEYQTSHKAGARSVSRKEAESRYPDRSMPAARKVAGAFGREPGGAAERDRADSLHPRSAPARHSDREIARDVSFTPVAHDADEPPATMATRSRDQRPARAADGETAEQRDAETQAPRANRARGKRTTT